MSSIGYLLSGIPSVFLLLDALSKLSNAAAGDSRPHLGVLELASVILYLTPATSAIGAVLLTAYLGGIAALHAASGSALPAGVVFPIYVGSLIWAGLLVRDARLRTAVFRWSASP